MVLTQFRSPAPSGHVVSCLTARLRGACSRQVGWGLPRRSGGEGLGLPVQRAQFSPWSGNWILQAAPETQPAHKLLEKRMGRVGSKAQGPFERALTVSRRGTGCGVRTGWEPRTRGAGAGRAACSLRTPDSSPPFSAAHCP